MKIETYDVGDKILYRRDDWLPDIGEVERVLVFANNDLITIFYLINKENISNTQVIKKL